jgi:putative FmdB family regulatory protein
MPVYEFVCLDCTATFEKRVAFSEADQQQECPSCGSSRSKKKLSQFSSTGKNTSTTGNSSPGCGSGSRFT